MLTMLTQSKILTGFTLFGTYKYNFSHFRITMDKESTIKVGETRRPFRMRLPSTSFVALVAVGVRYGVFSPGVSPR
jgi:hypothetical protein